MNQIIRMVMRFAMREGVNRGVDYMARRREEKIDPNAPGAQEMKTASKKQSQTMKRSLRMMRRLFRF